MHKVDRYLDEYNEPVVRLVEALYYTTKCGLKYPLGHRQVSPPKEAHRAWLKVTCKKCLEYNVGSAYHYAYLADLRKGGPSVA